MNKIREFIETSIEKSLFASRWLLAPFYIGLVVSLLIILYRFILELVHMITTAMHSSFEEVTIQTLGLLDATLLANLVLIMIFAGYESFVSKMEVAKASVDRPDWMGKVDFSALKMKLIGSIVAISAIGLLQDFMIEAQALPGNRVMAWRVGIHITFLASGVLFAFMDLLAEKRRLIEKQVDDE